MLSSFSAGTPSALTKNDNFSNAILSWTYCTTMEHWSAHQITCAVFVSTGDIDNSLISFAIDF